MVTKKSIDSFLEQKNLAIVGVSRSGKKFGTKVLVDLKKKGYAVFGVNPNAGEINGVPIYPDLASLPEKPDAAVLVVPPAVTEKVVEEANELGIDFIWMQQGAESKKAIQFCQNNNMTVVHGQCIMMHARPESIHKFHRILSKLFGKLPK